MNKILLVLLLLFVTPVKADNVLEEIKCAVESPVYKFASQLAGIAEDECRANKADDNYFIDPIVGCLKGHYGLVQDTIVGIYDIFKIILYEIPKWSIEQNARDVAKIMASDRSPSSIASILANVPVSRAEAAWAKTKEYWEFIKNFALELKNNLITHSKGFFCKPMEEQYEIICRAVEEIALTVIPVAGAGVQAVKWTGKTASSLVRFVRALKEAERLKGATLAQRLDYASDAVKASGATGASSGVSTMSTAGRDLMKLPDGTLKEVTLPDGEKILHYHTMSKNAQTGKMEPVVREISTHSATNAIDANKGYGKVIFEGVVSNSANKGSMVFVDVNYLGKVNYFKGGTQTGDKYLGYVADAIRKNLRADDIVFSKGGDELVVVLKTDDPAAIRAFSQRLIDEVDRSPEIRQIFRQEVSAITNRYKEINRANKYDGLTDEIKMTLTSAERDLARSNFAEFKRIKLMQLQAAFTAQSTFRGSVSTGSTILKPGEAADLARARAEAQAAVVKSRYKAAYDSNPENKYGVDANIETASAPLSGRRVRPIALDPAN